ncbi:hypothetical protein [Gemmatimonas sp.]|jgi:hypothetical protein|uniref:hypothetical protein n=1 Tax=Gemmatimonas sp. TaxID=1962908 RepID=UPI0026146735|nr:hypothetical protein [Gemmatimonas sp.]
MSTGEHAFQDFLALSSLLTGFTRFRLQGTGQADLYFTTVLAVVGEKTMNELLQAHAVIAAHGATDETALESLLRRDILSHEKLGPVARNIIKLWFIGTWYELPAEWRDVFGAPARDGTFVPAPSAYVEGLLWPTIGANPAGAKGPGYGTWAEPPRIPHH